jgi:hypothetical protein
VQAGPLEKVKIVTPATGSRYAFITFRHKVSVQYTVNLMNGIRLFDRPLRLQNRTVSGSSKPGTASGSCPNTPIHPGAGSSCPTPPPALLHMAPIFPSHVARFSSPVASHPEPFSNQHVSFHRSYSTPDCASVEQNVHLHRSVDGRRSGLLPVSDRTPYARPPSRQNTYQQQKTAGFDHLPPMAQLSTMWHNAGINGLHLTPRLPVNPQWHGDTNSQYRSGRHHQSHNSGSNSHRSHR